MGRSMKRVEAAKCAQVLLDQAIALLDAAGLDAAAAHVDMAIHAVNDYLESPTIKASDVVRVNSYAMAEMVHDHSEQA